MLASQPLTILEIRATSTEALNLFESQGKLAELGPNLAGLHWEGDFAFIFFTDKPGPQPNLFLTHHPELALVQTHHLTYGQWQDGAEAEPFTIGDLTVIAPGHSLAKSVESSKLLIIDPGLAFGFGGHPTTHCCLEFLNRICQHPSGIPSTALDLGSGTGVLSLAAARWGIEQTLGIDYSHLAVEAANHNLALNKLSAKVEFRRGPAQDYAAYPAEILLANLHLALQLELLNLGAFANRNWAIISGLLPSEGDELWAALQKDGFKMVDQVRTDRWITMMLRREI